MTVTSRESVPVQPLLERELLAVPEAVRELRRAVREVVDGGAQDVQLCVSELVTNVIVHLGAGTPVTLRVTASGEGRTKVALTDPAADRLPVPQRADDGAESGRGLALLDAVCLRWGVTEERDSKTVWCEVRTGAGAA